MKRLEDERLKHFPLKTANCLKNSTNLKCEQLKQISKILIQEVGLCV